MRRLALLFLVAAELVAGSHVAVLSPSRTTKSSHTAATRVRRLRGGDAGDDELLHKIKQLGGVGPLSRAEIVNKLNAVPTFCIMQEDGSVISLPDQDGAPGDECCTWFLDAGEAEETLKKVVAANPDLSDLRLVSHGLGDFIMMSSDGWPRQSDSPPSVDPAAPRLKLQGLREVQAALGEQLVTALKSENLSAGAWQAAVFIAEELMQASAEGAQILLPVFLSPHDVQAAYERAGIPAKALEGVKVLELRMLLKHMAEGTPDAVNPWRATQFIASPASLKLAHDVAVQ